MTRHTTLSLKAITAILVAFSFAASVAAFETGVSGQVVDETDAPLSGAVVTALTSQRAVVATATTGSDGRFTLSGLERGSYVVSVSNGGFEDRQVALQVTESSVEPLRITLTVAGLHEDVSVTAVPGTAVESSLAPQPVNLITRDEILARTKTVAAEAVTEEAGVHLQRTSPSMAGIFVRGLTGNKVNVFVDGVRYSNGAQRGGVNTFLDLIEPTSLESIEILRGPNSAEYGSDALGGSIQFLSRVPTFGGDRLRLGGEVGVSAQSAHEGGAGHVALSAGGRKVSLFVTGSGQSIGEIRPGDGIDSHNSSTRFLGLSSDVFSSDRLRDTGFHQYGGLVKVNWTPSASTQLVSAYRGTRQDAGDRYDQLIGGDGNLISELNDLTLDLFYARLERAMSGWFEHGTITYSLNSQREERVNQGGNGNARATIGHEPERTTAHGVQGSVSRALSSRQSLLIGGDVYFERLTSDAFNVNPVTAAVSPRRPRVPSDATFRQGGVFAQTSFEAVPDRVELVGALRLGGAHYEAHASDAPVVGGVPLWPDDSLSASSVTFRAGAVVTPSEEWAFTAGVARGFRAPHMTDLGTLGLTGSGFEVASPDVEGRGATVGSSAAATAVSTGDGVEQLKPETSVSFDVSARYRSPRARLEIGFYVNNVYDNIQKQALILPAGAVGQLLGTEVITQQNPNGTVLVAASASPVLVRANFDEARIWGIEHSGEIRLTKALRLNTVYTYTHARDTNTDLPPNIEGGTPAPDGYVLLMYAPPGQRWWVQPYLHAAAKQEHLSSLDLEDRRTGAGRNRTSIRNFFLNGATARGWVSAGADGAFGTADDLLAVTGETVTQIQDRVLGVGVNSSSLFDAVPGYTVFGVRGGLRFGHHEILVDLENLGDKNYRGISWGLDAPGRGIAVRYVTRF